MIKKIGGVFSNSKGWQEGMKVVCTNSHSRCYEVGGEYLLVIDDHGDLMLRKLGDPYAANWTGRNGEFEIIATKSLGDFM